MGGPVVGLFRGDSLLDAADFATRVAAHSVGLLEVIPSLSLSADLEEEAW
jgi:sugar/nucleoside kinase (ribokinase family)